PGFLARVAVGAPCTVHTLERDTPALLRARRGCWVRSLPRAAVAGARGKPPPPRPSPFDVVERLRKNLPARPPGSHRPQAKATERQRAPSSSERSARHVP